MGNTESAVVQKRMVRFRPEERPVVERVFDQLLEAGSGNAPGSSGKVLTLDALKVCVAGVAPESMTVRLFQAMRSVDPGGTAPPGGGVSREQLLVFLADVLRGTAEERAPLVMAMARREGEATVTADQVREFVEDLVSAVMSSELKLTDERSCDVPCLEDWLFRVSGVALYLELATSEGLGRRPLRLLFSTRLHGESFTRLVGCCARRGPTLLLLRDSHGHQFGGFASQSWDTKPQFQGDSRCFLFSVFPTLRVYTCTGYNQHYMYLNQGQQTMPNGLGMGGQHHYFGLWLDSDFGKGHSRARPRCTTYGSPQLSAQENFTVETLEVWGVGDPPEEQQAQGKRSVLDADPETQAIMEMTGKTLHSQGLREPEEEEL
ncbi:hypothetical protein ANANG_G00209010 [Anguilla anguilla]|uniref:MTOR-associated protein MEAK7 n=1 Tax=Anguilla anguilla TaxID=7936 RepID=A0A9D3RUA8_ANGAN|nr:hypothetical protein ANANG_G00209010 [Anguilla anguilla]